MNGSTHDDYLMREVEAVAAMLARVVGLRARDRTEDARALLEESYALLGPQADLLRRLDPRTAALMLALPERVLALARLTYEEAEQEKDQARHAVLIGRAFELALEAKALRSTEAATRRFITECAARVDPATLSPEARAALESILAGRGA